MNKVIMFAACLACSILSVNAQSSIEVVNNAVKVQDGTASFSVKLTNGDQISALQAGLSTVENLTISNAVSETGDSIKYSATSNVGTPIVVTYNFNNPTTSPSQTAFNGDKLFSVNATATTDFTKGEMTITPVASAIGGTGVTVSPITVPVRQNGDADGDGYVMVGDVVYIANAIASGSEYYYISDYDNDGYVMVGDVVAVASAVAAKAKAGQVDLGE